ncbi:MAG: hypothetical protein JXR37_17660 [Kiritimatiellae bacterium]|nr:hypothetical protein [Kiritimatiellia bacterium]
MQLYYGEAAEAWQRDSPADSRPVHRAPRLLVCSGGDHAELALPGGATLMLWGRVYALVQPDGAYRAVDLAADGGPLLAQTFGGGGLNEAIARLEGDFVGCLVRPNGEAVLFGDAFTRRDVFYSVSAGSVIAATDLSPWQADMPRRYDPAALANLLCVFGAYPPKKHTLYRDVRRLGVGERLVLGPDGARFETLPFVPAETGEYGQAELREYARLLEDAVRVRAAGTRNWVYLTGGWDSSTVLAVLVKHVGRERVAALTGRIALSDTSRDTNVFEAERGRQIAEYFDVAHDMVPWDLTTDYAVECWRKTAPFFRRNQVYAKNAVDYFFLAEHLRGRAAPADAVFAGEVADGAHNLGFACGRTIQEHPDHSFRAYADKMAAYLFGPTFLTSVLADRYRQDAVYRLLRSRLNGHVFDGDEAPLSERARKAKFIASFFARGARVPFHSLRNHAGLTRDGIAMYESELFNTYFRDCVESLSPANVYSWLLHLYNSFHWQGSTVKSLAEAARYNRLSLRLPYWDKRLQAFLSRMPEDWGRGLELRPVKYPLKWMAENALDYPVHLHRADRSFRNDVDPSFSLHAEFLYRSALAPHFKNRLKDYPFETVLDGQYFNLDYYRALADAYRAGTEETGPRLHDLNGLVLLCWVGWY